ncbi:RNA-guided endonuclease InsQ/TnpB family protein [Lactobacillus delbrueckii]|uniref:RNA-guided endonuclease InsQ/TnpB family protein n=1 Tax=Lactobacillus delbrueckii TaxID=1584 RepID=UPI001E345AF1|nr:transposase [Lactobacillus delbrueckii]MCD5452108.1 transposase [Lactobacillus delbrueckii subsp. lactis]
MVQAKRKKKQKTIPRNSELIDQLASEYYIKATPELDRAAEIAHKIYNAALYQLRQALFKRKGSIYYEGLDRIFKNKRNANELMLYGQMPTVQCAQQTIKEVAAVWKAWFCALQSYKIAPQKFTGRPRIPRYLKKSRRHTFYVTPQNARVKEVKSADGKDVVARYLIIHSLGLSIKLADGIKKVNRIAIKPLSNGYKLTVAYTPAANQKPYLPDNGRYIGIDPGVDNAFACVSNTGDKALLINGRAIKSANQYYNKRMAKLKSLQAQYHQLESIINTKQGPKAVYGQTKSMQRLTDWRNAKIRQFAHKASKRIVDYALSCGANTIVIGKNNTWKRSVNMGKKNNQNFIGLPHQQMINMIRYKANMVGITVICTNESYTSQTSALDGEKPCWNNGNKSRKKQGLSPANRRIHRGMFRSNKGLLVNADINGAMQIVRKVFPNVSFANGIVDAVLHPAKWSPLI